MIFPQLFRKEILITPSSVKLNHSNNFLLLGSCFTQNISRFLSLNGFNNFYPFGTLYNPYTIVKNLNMILNNEPYQLNDLIGNEDIFYSWNHSGSYCNSDKNTLLKEINLELSGLNKFLSNKSTIIITLGTSYVYEHKAYGIVGNCHKIPAAEFSKRILQFNEMLIPWKELITKMKSIRFIFTVSPVRHWTDGAVENTRSKSLLHLLVSELESTFDNVTYFPSYELMMDELRDYRFYKKDMLHPSDEAVEFIWDKFKGFCFSKESIQTINSISEIRKSIAHVPFNPTSKKHAEFLKKLLIKIDLIQKDTPYYKWDKEIIDIKKKIDAVN